MYRMNAVPFSDIRITKETIDFEEEQLDIYNSLVKANPRNKKFKKAQNILVRQIKDHRKKLGLARGFVKPEVSRLIKFVEKRNAEKGSVIIRVAAEEGPVAKRPTAKQFTVGKFWVPVFITEGILNFKEKRLQMDVETQRLEIAIDALDKIAETQRLKILAEVLGKFAEETNRDKQSIIRCMFQTLLGTVKGINRISINGTDIPFKSIVEQEDI